MNLLRPLSLPSSATLLGWHAEGPFIQLAKRGAHAPQFLVSASEQFASFEQVYGGVNLVDQEDWLMGDTVGIRIITAAPEIEGVMSAVEQATKRGVVFSIGHR